MLRLTLLAALLALMLALSPFLGSARVDSSAAIPVFYR